MIHINYINYYFLFIYKLSNKQMKQVICILRLFWHAWVIMLFFLNLVTFQYRSAWARLFRPEPDPICAIQLLAHNNHTFFYFILFYFIFILARYVGKFTSFLPAQPSLLEKSLLICQLYPAC